MKHPYRPKGCDDQGRHPDAAEAATEVGADSDVGPDYVPLVQKIAIGITAIGIVCLVVLTVRGV